MVKEVLSYWYFFLPQNTNAQIKSLLKCDIGQSKCTTSRVVVRSTFEHDKKFNLLCHVCKSSTQSFGSTSRRRRRLRERISTKWRKINLLKLLNSNSIWFMVSIHRVDLCWNGKRGFSLNYESVQITWWYSVCEKRGPSGRVAILVWRVSEESFLNPPFMENELKEVVERRF